MSIVHPSDSPFPENSVFAVHKGFRTGIFEYTAFRSAVNGYEPSKVRWAIFNDRKHAAEFVKTGVCPAGVRPIAKSDGDPERLGAAAARPTKVGSASAAGVATSQSTSTRSPLTPDASPEHESPPKPLPSSSTRHRIHDDSAVRLTVSQPPPAPKKPVAVAVSSDDEDDEGGDTEPEDEGEVSRVARGLPGPSRTPAASSQPAAIGKTPSMAEKVAQALRQSMSTGGLPETITDDNQNSSVPSTAPTSRPASSNTSTSRAGASSPTKAGPPLTTTTALPSTTSLSSTHAAAPKTASALSRTNAITGKAPTHTPLTPDPSRSSVVTAPQQAPVTPAPLTPAPSRTATTAPRTRLVLRTEPVSQTPELVIQPRPHGEYVRCHECTGTGWLLIPSTDNATTPAPSHPAGSIPTPTHTRTRTRTASKPRSKPAGGVTGSESEGFTREGSRLRIQSFGRSAAEGAGGVGPDRRTRPSKRVVSDGVLERKKRDKGKGKAIDVDAMDVDVEFPVAGPSNLDYTYIIYALCFAVLLEYEAMFRLLSYLYRYA